MLSLKTMFDLFESLIRAVFSRSHVAMLLYLHLGVILDGVCIASSWIPLCETGTIMPLFVLLSAIEVQYK